ncbi:MAG: HNH endonuclease [Caulobacteraceae bacterium]
MWVANTDPDWFDFLAAQPQIDEVNFWAPSGESTFRAVQAGELFLFKLKSPRNAIGGFGVFTQASNLPISLAWEAFGIKNGAPSLGEMRTRVGKYRKTTTLVDYTIGCRVLVQVVFLPEIAWIPQPDSWSNSIVVGKRFGTESAEGLRLWERVMDLAVTHQFPSISVSGLAEGASLDVSVDEARFGAPQLIRPRLGQGAFRIAVTEAYERECALSHGRVLPALDAAHIRAYGDGGAHEVRNGILLRRDIHSVFDAGYGTFDEDHRFVVSNRVRTEFNNGEEYRRLHGAKLRLPADSRMWPDAAALEWHRENVYRA